MHIAFSDKSLDALFAPFFLDTYFLASCSLAKRIAASSLQHSSAVYPEAFTPYEKHKGSSGSIRRHLSTLHVSNSPRQGGIICKCAHFDVLIYVCLSSNKAENIFLKVLLPCILCPPACVTIGPFHTLLHEEPSKKRERGGECIEEIQNPARK